MARTDVVVLGGGPAGYAAALRAATRGLKVTLVEAEKVGGTCLHWGCIPSKALLHVGDLFDRVRDAARLGLDVTVNNVDVNAINGFRRQVQHTLHRGLESLITRREIDLVKGRGTVASDGHTVLVDDTRYEGASLVLATGSRVRSLPGIGADGTVVITSDEATMLPRIPRRALIIGAGAVGLEFASLWRSLGAEEVTVVEMLDRIAPMEDVDASGHLARQFRKRGIVTVAPGQVEAVKVTDSVAHVTVVAGAVTREVEVDTVLIATGRAPRTERVGLEGLGILDDRGYVAVDGWCRTAVDGLYAVGDLLAPPSLALAHAGFAEGFLVADVIAGLEPVEPIDYAQVPRVTYTSPEVASVGLTEEQAKDRFEDVTAATYSLRGNAKAVLDDEDGLIKVVTAEGEVVGVHIVGPHATDLISEAQLVTAWGALPSEVAALVHPHPTLAEALGEAHLLAAGLPFHTH